MGSNAGFSLLMLKVLSLETEVKYQLRKPCQHYSPNGKKIKKICIQNGTLLFDVNV